jgi:hypothetical protein
MNSKVKPYEVEDLEVVFVAVNGELPAEWPVEVTEEAA